MIETQPSVVWRHELLSLSTLFMDACWVYGWLALFLLLAGRPAPSPLHLAALSVAGLYTARLVGDRRAVGAAVGVAAVLWLVGTSLSTGVSALSPTFFVQAAGGLLSGESVALLVAGASVYLWWRATQVASRRLDIVGTALRFRIGVLIVIALLVASAFARSLDFTPLVFLYFTLGLLAIALARIEDVGTAEGGSAAPFGRGWLMILSGALAAAGAAAWLMARLMPPVLSALYRLLSPLLDPLLDLLLLLALAVAYLVQWLVVLASRVLPSRNAPLPTPAPRPTPSFDRLRELPATVVNPMLLLLIKAGLILLFAAFVFWLISRAYQQRRAASAGREAKRESILSLAAVSEDLAAWLRGRLNRVRAMIRRPARSAATIREMYASLLDLAAERGFPRPADDTPYEYLDTLRSALPGHSAEVSLLTQAYVRARYGELPADNAEWRAVHDAWLRIRTATKSSRVRADGGV